MDQTERSEEINLMEYLEVLWKRKWLIIIPTFLLMIIVGIISFRMKPVWEVDALIQPGKFFVQTQSGQFEEVVVVDPKQLVGQINQNSYNNILAAELNIDQRKFPGIKAEALKDTKFVRTSVRDNDVKRATQIITALFAHLKSDYDKRIDVEIQGIDTQITEKENIIKDNENEIKSKENDIKKKNNDIKIKELEAQSKKIEKDRLKNEIEIDRNKLGISEERQKNILDEMKSVKARIDEIDKQLQNALSEKKQGADAIALLLYSNEVQQNLRYYNTLDEKISIERITQENLSLNVHDKEEQLRQLDNQVNQIEAQKDSMKAEIESIKNEIEKIKNSINTQKSDIQLVRDKKGRIDYTTLIKVPTASLNPVSPNKKKNVLIAGSLGFLVFAFLAFFLEYIKKNKKRF